MHQTNHLQHTRPQRRPVALQHVTACIASLVVLLLVGLVSAQALPSPQTNQSAAAISKSTAAPDEPNATCPVTLGEKIDPDQWVDYQGKRVYLCCARCKRKFEADPQAYVANLPAMFKTTLTPATSADSRALVTATEQTVEPHSDHEHESNAAHTSSTPVASQGAESEHDEAHDHAAHHHGSSPSFLSKLISWLGKFHPPTTHFPIALIVAALVAEALFIATGKLMFDAAARFTVWFAIIGTVAAVILGWFFSGFKLSDGDWIMTTHRWVGTAAGLWTLVLAWTACKTWADPPVNATTWRQRFRVALVVAVLLISVNGFLGGALMYGLSHYGW